MSNSKHKKKAEGKNVHAESAPAEEKEEKKEQEESTVTEQDEKEILKARIEELKSEVSEIKDQMLRKQAELDNFRKRLLKDKEESIKYANANLLADLITIIDDFERAIQSATASRDFDSFHSGIELIEKQFTGMLEKKWGLTRIVSVGEEFDPQKHEAIGMEESPDYDTETVIEDYQKGYILQDRVIRPAKVKVAMPLNKNETEAGETVADTQ